MYLLGQTTVPPTPVEEDRRTAIQGAIIGGLLLSAFWAWLKIRPKVTFRPGYPKKRK